VTCLAWNPDFDIHPPPGAPGAAFGAYAFGHGGWGGYGVGGSGGGGLASLGLLGAGAYTISLSDVLDSITGCIESESSLDDMDRLCHRVTQYIFEGHCLDSDTKKNMRPLLEKCLSNRWYQQFQNLSHLVYGDDPMWSNEPSYNLAGAWNAVALLDSEAEVVQLQKELSTTTKVSDMAKALVRTMERASNSEENAHMLEAKVENAVVKAAEAGVAAAGATESASEAARLAFRAIDGIRAVENTVTSQGDRIDRLEEHDHKSNGMDSHARGK
jgi:hypothetical protein